MKLLDLHTQKQQKNKQVQSQIKRVEMLNDAENKLSRSYNQKKKYIERRLEKMDKYLNDYKLHVKQKTADLKKEVTSLETKRADAMLPINNQRKDAQTMMDKAEMRIKLADDMNTAIEKDREGLMIWIEESNNFKDELDERETQIILDENNSIAQQDINKTSTETLAKNWVEYHNSVNEFNKEIQEKENEVAIEKKAVKIAFSILRDEQKDLKNDKKALRDKYVALAQASKHLNYERKKR